MIGLGCIDDGPVGDPDANPRLYDFLKEQNQRAGHFMIGANIHDNLQRRSGPRRLPVYSLGAGHGWSDIGRQSSTQHADWYDQYSYYLLSLLTCLRPTSPPPLIAEVRELSATLPPSTLNAAFPSPVLPPGLPFTEASPMPAQAPVLSFPSPASLDGLTLSLSIFLTDPKHRARAPAVPSLLRLGGATAKRSPASPSTRPRHRYRPPSACRATTGHRSRL